MLGQLCGGSLLAIARRALTVLVAVALVVLPLGAATDGMHALVTKHTSASAHVGQVPPQEGGAAAAIARKHGTDDRQQMAADSDFCDDEDTCAQTCFGELAVIPSQRTAILLSPFHHIGFPADRLPGWSATPQLPPPRT